MQKTPAISAQRDPRQNRPWIACGNPRDPAFGHLWASHGHAGATMLYWNRNRTDYATTLAHTAEEGELIDVGSRDWIVTWEGLEEVEAAEREANRRASLAYWGQRFPHLTAVA